MSVDYKRARLSAEAQMRRADSFWAFCRTSHRRARLFHCLELSRRSRWSREFSRLDGPRASVLRLLELAADAAHDRRLIETETMKSCARSARNAEMQARVLYEESEGRVNGDHK